jgi:hypothetical protein
MLHSICHVFIMNQPFDDHSSISDTESSVPHAAGAGAAASKEEGPETTATQGEALCQCQQVYEGSGNEKKVLYLMCIGLNHNGLPLFSFENEPWSQLPKTSLVRPKNTDYGKEVSRRAILYVHVQLHVQVIGIVRRVWNGSSRIQLLTPNVLNSLPMKYQDFTLCWKEPNSNKLQQRQYLLLLVMLVVLVDRTGKDQCRIFESLCASHTIT